MTDGNKPFHIIDPGMIEKKSAANKVLHWIFTERERTGLVRRRQQRVYFDQYWWKVKTLHQRFSLFPLLFYSRTLFLSSIHPT